MKKIFYFIVANIFSLSILAQCNTTEEVNNLPLVCTKKVQGSSAPTAEQIKNLTAIFSSVIEPALKNSKGMRGTWNPIGSSGKTTPEKLMKSEISIYLDLLGCNKEHKVYSIPEAGLRIGFYINDLSLLCDPSIFETEKNNQTIYINNEINGSQIYRFKREKTETEKYEELTYYSKTDNAKYFLITKSDVPFFIPVTVKQGLEINKKNSLYAIDVEKKKSTAIKLLSKEEWIKKEGIKATPGIFTPQMAQELNDAGYSGYSEGTKQAIATSQLFQSMQEKNIKVIEDFLKSSDAKTLEQPVKGSPFSYYTNIDDLKTQLLIDNDVQSNSYFIINPAYLDSKLPKTTPQFVCIELRKQKEAAVTQKVFKDFEDKLDLEKLKSFLVK
jgi:hypothetical protein